MTIFASNVLFEDDGSRDENNNPTGGIWYKPPLRWDTHAQMYRDRANIFLSLMPGLTRNVNNPTQGARVLVAGAGYGFLISALNELGYYAWGVDGLWARDQSQIRMPGLQDRMGRADCTLTADLQAFRTATGIRNRRFDAVITEDLLTSVQDAAQAQAMLVALRDDSCPVDRSRVLHFVTCHDETQPWSGTPVIGAEWLRRTEAEWITLIGTNAERIVNVAGNRIVR